MRKRIVARRGPTRWESSESEGPLPVAAIAQLEVTSEDPNSPIEGAFTGAGASGWQAGSSGEQRITIIFDHAERVRRIALKFIETERARTQEFVLTWSQYVGGAAHVIVRQQWVFSPTGSTIQSESYETDLHEVGVLELTIKPDLTDSTAIASLNEWLVFD